ncbi:MAG TPA: DNRLRE domain-containing protein [Candidatus Nanoarchaeia archaeon]|nr:DNRLRE domain-containing protein [Candidatus Nanoarchaeia archaeon]
MKKLLGVITMLLLLGLSLGVVKTVSADTLSLNPVQDNYVSSRYTGAIYSIGFLKLIDTPLEKNRIYLKFNSTLFMGKNISSAKLNLSAYFNDGKNTQKLLYHVTTDSWQASTLTYGNRPNGSELIGSETSSNIFTLTNLTVPTNDSVLTLLVMFNETGNYSRLIYNSSEMNNGKPILAVVFSFDDLAAPVVTLVSPADNTNTSSSPTFSYTVTDDSDIKNCTLIINNIINKTSTSVSKGITQTFTQTSMNVGPYNWTVNCTDNGNNKVVGTATKRTFNVTNTTYIVPSGVIELNPVADAHVSTRYTGKNYGGDYLRLADFALEKNRIYLKFDTSSLVGKTITSANLTLTPAYDFGKNQAKKIFNVSSDSWTETGITSANAPANGSSIGNTSFSHVFNITSLTGINDDGTFSVAVKFEESASYAKVLYGSREFGTKPKLSVVYS